MVQLQEIPVNIDDLYLDPNNPRYIDLTDNLGQVPLARVPEEAVQQLALARMMDERFEVRQLMDSIRTVGFLIVDRLIVIALPPSHDKYMVVEGNRRLAAIKTLLSEHTTGQIDLQEQTLLTLRSFPVLMLLNSDERRQQDEARLLQAIRHVSGIRPWGPYQQARIIAMMLDDGRSYSEIRETLGLSTRRINILRRGYYALQQVREDDDFGDQAKPSLFSYFDEVFRVPSLRDWLGWNDDANRFDNSENVRRFYEWVIGPEEEGDRYPPKIADARQIRRLPDLIQDTLRFREFCENPTLTLEQALRGVVTGPQEDYAALLRTHAGRLLVLLNQIPAVALQEASEADVSLFHQIDDLCQRHIRMINTYRGT